VETRRTWENIIVIVLSTKNIVARTSQGTIDVRRAVAAPTQKPRSWGLLGPLASPCVGASVGLG
jgi:hypothetical protein